MPSVPSKFLALRIHEEDEKPQAKLEQISLKELTDGEVVIKNSYSGINYKDALAVTGAGKILRSFPLVGGVDVAGVVVESKDPRFKEGDPVIAACSGLSETNDGGYAEYSRLTKEAAIALPEKMDLRTSMAIGTAGFAAGLAIYKMTLNNQRPSMGPVAVTGASGGVGSIATNMLSSMGYEVAAITGKKQNEEYLKQLGASSVIVASENEIGTRPLEKSIFGGAIDNLGGETLSWLLRATQPEGNVASIGLAADFKLSTNVMPFILRGVNLLGVNSTTLPNDFKQMIWEQIAEKMIPVDIEKIITKEVLLEDAIPEFQGLLDASITGRTIIKIS